MVKGRAVKSSGFLTSGDEDLAALFAANVTFGGMKKVVMVSMARLIEKKTKPLDCLMAGLPLMVFTDDS